MSILWQEWCGPTSNSFRPGWPVQGRPGCCRRALNMREPIRFTFVPLGWEQRAWAGCYYPQDLPPEWRLGYFANEFPGVALEPGVWISVPDAVICGWVEDVPDRFRFYPLLPTQAVVSDLRRRVRLFGDRLGGLVVTCPVDEAAELLTPQYLLVSLEDALAGRFWGSRLALKLPAGCLGDLRQKRGILECLDRTLLAGTEVLGVIDGRSPDLDELRQLEQLALLLGMS